MANTTLTLTPNFDRKTLTADKIVAVGEDLNIVMKSVPSGKKVRVRFRFLGVDLAVSSILTSTGEDVTASVSFETEQFREIFEGQPDNAQFRVEALLEARDVVTHAAESGNAEDATFTYENCTLWATGAVTVRNWPKFSNATDEPTKILQYKASIKEYIDTLVASTVGVLKGDDGKSAYELWVAAGNTGSVTDFLADLHGAAGTLRFMYCDDEQQWHRIKLVRNSLNKLVPAIDSDAVNFDDSDSVYVYQQGAQTISGVKTFGVSPLVPTATDGDSSQKAASTAFVQGANKYNLVTKTLVADETGTGKHVDLDNGAMNALTLDDEDQAVTINVPAAVSGKARDFLLVLTIGDFEDCEITLSGGTFKGAGASTFSLSTSATNVISFTEITSGVFAMKRTVFSNTATEFGVE